MQGHIRFDPPRHARRLAVWLASGALALVAIWVTVAWLLSDLEEPDRSRALHSVAGPDPLVPRGSDGTPIVPSPVSDPVTVSEMPRLADSTQTNLRTVVHQAKAQRETGGLLRAHTILLECRYMKPPSPYDGPNEARRLAVARSAAKASACAAFTQDELRDAGFSRGQGDPKADIAIQISERLRPGTSEADRRSLAAQILSDPNGGQLITVPRLMAKDGKEGGQPTYYLDQKAFGGVDPKLYLIALDLLPCAFGEDCGPTGPIVSEQCASNGFCAANAFEMRRAAIGRPGQYETMLGVYNRLKEALATGDLTALTPPMQ